MRKPIREKNPSADSIVNEMMRAIISDPRESVHRAALADFLMESGIEWASAIAGDDAPWWGAMGPQSLDFILSWFTAPLENLCVGHQTQRKKFHLEHKQGVFKIGLRGGLISWVFCDVETFCLARSDLARHPVETVYLMNHLPGRLGEGHFWVKGEPDEPISGLIGPVVHPAFWNFVPGDELPGRATVFPDQKIKVYATNDKAFEAISVACLEIMAISRRCEPRPWTLADFDWIWSKDLGTTCGG